MKNQVITNGSAAAAILAAAIGSFTFGMVVCLSENIKAVEKLLTLSKPVGALSGKTDAALAVWLVAWLVLWAMWRGREIRLGRVFAAAAAIIILALLATFPPFFYLI